MRKLVIIGGSDAGIGAALRAKELGPQINLCQYFVDCKDVSPYTFTV